MKKSPTTSVKVNSTLWASLKVRASKNGQTVTWLVNRAIEKYLREGEVKP
jgi:predicted DNA-binding protein